MPIAAKGPQAANVSGTLDQTEVYDMLKGFTAGAAEERTAEIQASLKAAAKPKNTVVLLLDGFDHQLMTAARDYELGADGRF